MTKKIAVVGIDGAGKSTVVRRLLELAGGEVSAMTCPAYHDTPNAPLAELSRAMEDFSRAADSLGSFELKATALFLQMTLYGPVERFFLETFRPRHLVSERHALVDSLAYGPFYTRMIRRAPDRSALEGPLRERLGAGYEAILAWSPALWEVALQVRDLFSLPWPEQISELGRAYRTRLPDSVLFLDAPVATALERLSGRSQAELHEKAAVLAELRESYLKVLERLEVETHVIRSSGSLEETLQGVLEASGAGAFTQLSTNCR